MKGIVFDGKDLKLVDGLTLREPNAQEVVVEIRASGVCQSDLSVVKGTIPYPTPVVLGHEGAGVVVEVGSAVENVAIGDAVALSTLGQCGACPACDSGRPTMCRSTFGHRPQPYALDGEAYYSFANLSTFAERVVVKSNQAVRIPAEIPFASAALIGCGVLTGTGAVLHRARVQAGDSVVVLGTGGIGLNVLQAARLAGAHPIIAVDANPEKEAIARQFGATDFVLATNATEAKPDESSEGRDGLVATIRERAGGFGAQHVFECVGRKQLIEDAIRMVDWGGQVILVGVTAAQDKVDFFPVSAYLDVTIMGCRYGSSQPQRDIPRICELVLAGRLELDALVSQRYELKDFESLVADLNAGRIARGVLDMPSSKSN